MSNHKPFEPFVVMELVRSRIRRDGGPLVEVTGTTQDGRPFVSETLCPFDGEHLMNDLKFNGWTDLKIRPVEDLRDLPF